MPLDDEWHCLIYLFGSFSFFCELLLHFFRIIYVLLSIYSTVRGAKPGKSVQLSEAEIKGLCIKSREIFLSQPILLELEAPLKICGKHSSIDP